MVRHELKRLPPSRRKYVRTFPALLLAKGIPGTRPAPFPAFIDPSLATLRPKPPPGELWVHEIKYDGYRLQLHVRQGSIRLLTRRGYDWTDRFASIAAAAWHQKTYAAVIDGEVIVATPEGHSDFHALEHDLGSRRLRRANPSLLLGRIQRRDGPSAVAPAPRRETACWSAYREVQGGGRDDSRQVNVASSPISKSRRLGGTGKPYPRPGASKANRPDL